MQPLSQFRAATQFNQSLKVADRVACMTEILPKLFHHGRKIVLILADSLQFGVKNPSQNGPFEIVTDSRIMSVFIWPIVLDPRVPRSVRRVPERVDLVRFEPIEYFLIDDRGILREYTSRSIPGIDHRSNW